MAIKGVDISQFNSIDLNKAKGEGFEFAIVRATYGGGGKDAKFAQYWSAAKNAGMVRLAYHFAYPGRSSGAQQAKEFLATVGGLSPGDGLVLDMEDETSYGRTLVPSDVNWAKEFLDTCTNLTGVKPLLYINTDLKGRFDWSSIKNADYGLWHANYGSNNGSQGTEPAPAPWGFNAIWQYTSQGTAGGAHPIDLNVFNGTREQLAKYGAGGAVAPTPAPTPPPQPAQPTPSAKLYTVVKGDTLSSIASRFNTTWNALASLNRLSDPNLIFPGQQLQVGSQTAAQRTYTVARGDSLSTIAGKVGTTVNQLVSLNGIANPNLIFPAQVLKY
jgi:GH25 family lysozyme M1 (1,4-beta-N-acetylmuramidase)/LysM repeat protein